MKQRYPTGFFQAIGKGQHSLAIFILIYLGYEAIYFGLLQYRMLFVFARDDY